MLELKIVNLYNDGWSMTKIAKLIGRGKDFVRNRLKMNKVFIRRTSSKRRYVRFSDLTFAKKTAIALDYRTGFKVDDIKNKYRLSDYALYKVLEEKGVKLRSADKVKPLKNPPSELSQKIVEMYKAGATRKDIMLALGLEKDHVIYDSLRSAGVLSHEKAKGI